MIGERGPILVSRKKAKKKDRAKGVRRERKRNRIEKDYSESLDG